MKIFKLLVLLAIVFTSCQNEKLKTVLLSTKYSKEFNNTLMGVDSIIPKTEVKFFKGIDSFKLKYFKIYSYSINRGQQYYLDYLHKKLSKADLLEMFKFYKMDIHDTVNFTNNEIKNSINILSGLNNHDERVIVIDANNDNDFSNDIEHTYNKLQQKNIIEWGDYSNKIPLTKINFEKYFNKKIVSDSAFVKALPFANFYSGYTDSLEKSLQVAVQDTKYKFGKLNIDGKNYTLYIIKIKGPFDSIYNKKNTSIQLVPSNQKRFLRSQSHVFNDIIPIDKDHYLKFAFINSNTLSYSEYDLKSTPGINVGQPFPSHLFYNYKSNISKQIAFEKQHYTLIDFWGTWCGPCIAAMPHVDSLYKEFSNKKNIRFIGIAYDEKDKTKKMISILKTNHIEYENLIDDKGLDTNSFEKKYHVFAYPTIILVNNKGTVIFRTNNNDDYRNELYAFLKQLK